jgi:hypothetical protein
VIDEDQCDKIIIISGGIIILFFFLYFIGCFYDEVEKCVEKKTSCSDFNGRETGCENKDNGVDSGLMITMKLNEKYLNCIYMKVLYNYYF